MIPLTIIISAYNRLHSLATLLGSMKRLDCSQKVNLVISVDNKGTEAVNSLAKSFQWHLGEKEVIVHQEKLGLINHFIWIGDQTEKYDHVLFLEDDMFVSPMILEYAFQVIPKYEDDDRVAGCSLYNPLFCLSGIAFDKVCDGYDNFFFQHPYWGNIWYKKKWEQFKEYLVNYKCKDDLLPLAVQTWRSGSFKKIFIQYLIEKNRTIVFPKTSLLTNMGEPGLHSNNKLEFVQVPFELNNTTKKYYFSTFDESLCIYDAFEEYDTSLIKKYNPQLQNYNFVLDTKLNRNSYSSEYVLTTRQVNNALLTFSSGMKPFENNLILNVPGVGISLGKSENVLVAASDESRILDQSIRSHFCIKISTIMKYELKNILRQAFYKSQK